MAITIQGIKICTVQCTVTDGQPAVSGSYELVGPTGLTVAKQNFNGYGDIKLPVAGDLLSAYNNLFAAVRSELNKLLGVE